MTKISVLKNEEFQIILIATTGTCSVLHVYKLLNLKYIMQFYYQPGIQGQIKIKWSILMHEKKIKKDVQNLKQT
mgnify:FL=1